MKAEVQTFFGIVGSSGFARVLKIPFFQRAYVWDKENWEPLLDDLLDPENDHFLGSVILKPGPDGFGLREWNVIDGQQRLTTLSVLLKVCGDKILAEPQLSDSQRCYYDRRIKDALFVLTADGDKIKLQHSMVDRGAYESVLTGTSKYDVKSTAIIDCKKYFEEHVDLGSAKKIFEMLIGDHQKEILVGIILDGTDHEQAIFDTINTAGVRLTIADTVKNYIFQKYLDVSKNEKAVFEDYALYWEGVFAGDEVSLKYWSEIRNQGRIERTTLEVFLQCVAIVKGIFDPQEKGQSLSKLADYYKKYIDNFQHIEDFKSFLPEMAEMAKAYREFFAEFRDEEILTWSDSRRRALHIFKTCDTSTFDPLILKLFMDSKASGAIGAEELDKSLDELSSYVLRHVVAGASVKNFNKECVSVIKHTKTISDYLSEKKNNGEIDDESVRRGLRHIKKSYNKIAKEILFWMEIKRRGEETSQFMGLPVNYKSDLEHIMPQTWGDYWPITNPTVVDPVSGITVADPEVAIQLRKNAVFEIGNMSLLTTRWNRQIQNREMEIKLKGDGAGIPGIDIKKIDIRYTRDVLNEIVANGYLWNEKTIRDRTNKLSDLFLSMW